MALEHIARSEDRRSAVFFSGATAVLALIGMVIVPHSIFLSLGLGAILVAIMAVMPRLQLVAERR